MSPPGLVLVLDDAVKWGRLVRNPADAATPQRARDAKESAPAMRTWTAAQLDRFLELVKEDRYGPAWFFLATTGMRRREALGLTWDDVDLEHGTVSIHRTRIAVKHEGVYGRTKTGRSRVIEIGGRTVAVLKAWRAQQAREKLLLGVGYKDEGLIFAHADGRPYHPERFSREFDRRLERWPELPRIRLHDLRHTWATLALAAGEHPKVAAERLGHANISVTIDTYSHVSRPVASDAAERVEELIFRRPV